MWKHLLFIVMFSGLAAQAADDHMPHPSAKPTPTKPTPAPLPFPGVSSRTLKYYEIGKTDGPVLYTQKIQFQVLPSSELSTKSVVTDSKGNVVFTESLISKGHQPIFQTADVQQTRRHLELEVKDDQVFLRTRGIADNDEKPKEDREKLPENFITGALAETFVNERFDELMAGETVSAKMAILEIRELVKFKFWKKDLVKENGRDVMIVAMKPSSIFIAFLVDTIYLHIDVKSKKMVHYVGRTPLWKESGKPGDLKALDAEIVFE